MIIVRECCESLCLHDLMLAVQLWWEQIRDHQGLVRRHVLVTGENVTRYMGRLMQNEVRSVCDDVLF
jgi:hypothetical protein